MPHRINRIGIVLASLLLMAGAVHAQFPATQPATRPARSQEDLETELSAILTNATLEGSYVSTGRGADPTKVNVDRYLLGSVRKLAGKMWLIQAQIKYGENEMMIPIMLPIEWAGDTPVIVVDNFTIPGMGTFNARVMFFDGHYSGYWKHGTRGGNMFGVIRRAPTTVPAAVQ